MVKMPSPTIIIFANAPPPDSFRYALSADRWRAADLRNAQLSGGRFLLDEKEFPGVVDDDRYMGLDAAMGPPVCLLQNGLLTASRLPIVVEDDDAGTAAGAAGTN
jgi:hypothetical protein